MRPSLDTGGHEHRPECPGPPDGHRAGPSGTCAPIAPSRRGRCLSPPARGGGAVTPSRSVASRRRTHEPRRGVGLKTEGVTPGEGGGGAAARGPGERFLSPRGLRASPWSPLSRSLCGRVRLVCQRPPAPGPACDVTSGSSRALARHSTSLSATVRSPPPAPSTPATCRAQPGPGGDPAGTPLPCVAELLGMGRRGARLWGD